MRLLGIEEARTRSEYVTTVLNQSVDAKGFEYPADLAVFKETQHLVKFLSALLCQFDGPIMTPMSALLYLLHTEARQQ